MLTFRQSLLFASIIDRHFKGRSDDARLRQELLVHRRRELLHQHIPDVYAARADFGPRSEELPDLLLSHDPAGLNDRAAPSPYYPELARTLLLQLSPTQSKGQMHDFLQQELSRWFGHSLSKAARVPRLAEALYQWRIS